MKEFGIALLKACAIWIPAGLLAKFAAYPADCTRGDIAYFACIILAGIAIQRPRKDTP